MMKVEIQSDDQLKRELWGFHMMESRLHLKQYAHQSRQSKRHKFKNDAMWSAHSHEMRDIVKKLDKPTEIPEAVMRDALSQINIRFLIGVGREAEQAGHYSLLEGTAF